MMINDQPCQDHTVGDAVLVRALNSITPRQTATIAQAVRAADAHGGWALQVTDDYDGYRCMLVEPNTPDGSGTCYFVSGTAQRLDLFAALDDQLTPVGCFSDVDDLSTKLAGLIVG